MCALYQIAVGLFLGEITSRDMCDVYIDLYLCRTLTRRSQYPEFTSQFGEIDRPFGRAGHKTTTSCSGTERSPSTLCSAQ